jgi:hypothetical protein
MASRITAGKATVTGYESGHIDISCLSGYNNNTCFVLNIQRKDGKNTLFIKYVKAYHRMS